MSAPRRDDEGLPPSRPLRSPSGVLSRPRVSPWVQACPSGGGTYLTLVWHLRGKGHGDDVFFRAAKGRGWQQGTTEPSASPEELYSSSANRTVTGSPGAFKVTVSSESAKPCCVKAVPSAPPLSLRLPPPPPRASPGEDPGPTGSRGGGGPRRRRARCAPRALGRGGGGRSAAKRPSFGDSDGAADRGALPAQPPAPPGLLRAPSLLGEPARGHHAPPDSRCSLRGLGLQGSSPGTEGDPLSGS